MALCRTLVKTHVRLVLRGFIAVHGTESAANLLEVLQNGGPVERFVATQVQKHVVRHHPEIAADVLEARLS
jgi:hypothetical protein